MSRHQEIDDIPGDVPEAIEQQQLNIPASYKDGLNMLEHLLKDKSTIYTSKILTIMLQYKIKADDPIFLLLLCTAELEQLMVNLPLSLISFGEEFLSELESLFKEYFGEDADTQQRFDLANAEYLALVAAGAEKIIDNVSERKFYGNVNAIAKTIGPALGMLVLSFGLGVFGTLHFNKLSTRALVGSGKLTVEQLEALDWAQSNEGKQLRRIGEYNSGYIGKACKEDAQALKVSLNFGNRKATKGFCVLFVDPPEQRF